MYIIYNIVKLSHLQKTNLVKRLISKETNSEADVAMFEEIKLGLETKEAELQQDLVQVESRISATIRLVEIAISLVVSCAYAFKKAPNDQVRALLARTLFKSLKMRDGKIVEAKLNEPLDYILIKNLRKSPDILSPIQIEQASVCDQDRTLLEYLSILPSLVSAIQRTNFENCYKSLEENSLIK